MKTETTKMESRVLRQCRKIAKYDDRTLVGTISRLIELGIKAKEEDADARRQEISNDGKIKWKPR